MTTIYKGYFTPEELDCSHCKKQGMDPLFMEMVVELRERLRFPFIVTSGYRCPSHPNETHRTTSAHQAGKAIDICVSGPRALKLIREALNMGFVGLGVSQKGADLSKRFIHLDMWVEGPRPSVWSY
jgi:zinc D-Ala-D-Ala carboxypeptidase